MIDVCEYSIKIYITLLESEKNLTYILQKTLLQVRAIFPYML